MPLPKTDVVIASDEDDVSVEDTDGNLDVPEQAGNEARDRRGSTGSGNDLIRRALLPYVLYKIFLKNMPFPMAQ